MKKNAFNFWKFIVILSAALLSMQAYSGDKEKKQCKKNANNEYRECIDKQVYESNEYMKCGQQLRKVKNQCKQGKQGKR